MTNAMTNAQANPMPIAPPTRQPEPAPVLFDLEYSADLLAGAYAAVRSWAQLDALASRVGALSCRWLIVQRCDDAGQRFAQCVRSGDAVIVEVGALDATTGRHTVWRLHRAVRDGLVADGSHFMRIARDWLGLGVVPGYSATTVRLDGADKNAADDEPF